MRHATLLIAPALLAAFACGRADDTHAAGDSTHDTARATPSLAAHDSAQGAPLALRPIMQLLGVEMARLANALWIDDYAALDTSATAIASHPHIAPEEVARIERILGSEVATFDSLDRAVHEASLALQRAAQSRDSEAIVNSLGTVQQGCVACHSQFRERLRTVSR